MNWFTAAFVLSIAFLVGYFVGHFHGYKFGLLRPPRMKIYFLPMSSIRLGEWGLQVRLTERIAFRIGRVSEDKDPSWQSSETEVYFPNGGIDGFPHGWLEALCESVPEVSIGEEVQLPFTMTLAEAIGLVRYDARPGRKSRATSLQEKLSFVQGWKQSGLSADDYGQLRGVGGSTLEKYLTELKELGFW